MIIVSGAISGRFHSASWNGESLYHDELMERETERKWARCAVGG